MFFCDPKDSIANNIHIFLVHKVLEIAGYGTIIHGPRLMGNWNSCSEYTVSSAELVQAQNDG